MNVLILDVYPNAGYSAGGVLRYHSAMTVGELRAMLADRPDDMPVLTYDVSQGRGASWGYIPTGLEPDEVPADADA